MPSLKEVARADAPEDIQKVYDAVFGPGVDPVSHPGTATGTPATGGLFLRWFPIAFGTLCRVFNSIEAETAKLARSFVN